jgi:hypothetical protein
MTEAKKVGNRYVVYDHILNINKTFKSKADADDYAEALNKKSTTTEEIQEPNPNENQNDNQV